MTAAPWLLAFSLLPMPIAAESSHDGNVSRCEGDAFFALVLPGDSRTELIHVAHGTAVYTLISLDTPRTLTAFTDGEHGCTATNCNESGQLAQCVLPPGRYLLKISGVAGGFALVASCLFSPY